MSDKPVSLRIALGTGLTVDRDNGVIAGVSVITGGLVPNGSNAPPFTVDATMLQQVVDAINASPSGIRSRMTHPELTDTDGIGLIVGKVKNARIEGNQVKADFHRASFAEDKDINRIFGLAEEAPEDAGLSIVFGEGNFEHNDAGEVVGRVESLTAIDWVGIPAANPNGMLSESKAAAALASAKPIGDTVMNEAQISLLQSFGLAESSTPEEITAFADGLDDVQRAQLAELADGDEDEAQLIDDMPTEEEVPVPAAPVDEDEEATGAAASEANQVATLAERKRCGDITKAVTLARTINSKAVSPALTQQFIDGGFTPGEAREELIKKLAATKGPIKMDTPQINAGPDKNIASLQQAIPDAIMLRANARGLKNPHKRAAQLSGRPVLDLCRIYFSALGVENAYTLNNTQVVSMLGRRKFARSQPAQVVALAQSTSDFDEILADAINKSLKNAYEDKEPSWQLWASRGTAPDFKTIHRAGLSEVPDLQSVDEGGEVEYVTLTDHEETYSLVEYKGGLRLTRRALINDDLSAFDRIPRLQALAARRKEDDVAYAILTANAAMGEDATALFAAGHNNLAAGTANVGAPTVAFLNAGHAAMFGQQGPKTDAFLELVPRYLLIPEDLKATADQLIGSTADPANSNSNAINPFHNTLQVIPSARLGADSTTNWYLATGSDEIDTVEVSFLQDEQTPVLDQETDFDTDDMKFKVRHTVAAKALDWRGLYSNPGA